MLIAKVNSSDNHNIFNNLLIFRYIKVKIGRKFRENAFKCKDKLIELNPKLYLSHF